MLGRAALVAILWLADPMVALARSPAQNPQSVADAILARDSLQRDLPQPQNPWWTLQLDPDLARWLLWGGVLFGAIVIVISMRDSLPAWDRSRRLSAAESLASGNGDDGLAAARLEADDLARAGRFGDAMHTLLLRAVEELRERLRVAFADSLTSREIVRRAPLDENGRLAFAAIVGSVEAVVFGEFGADEAAYRACSDNFEVLRHSLSVAGAR
jgi:hypothetical protein